MFQKLMCKLKPTPTNFIAVLNNGELDTNLLNVMLEKGDFSINHLNKNDESFLHIVIKNRKFKSAQWLIENNIDVSLKDDCNQQPIQLAIEKDNTKIVKLLLQTNKIDINQIDNEGRSLLHNSVLHGNRIVSADLISYGIDINIKDDNNRNVVFDAINNGKEVLLNDIINLPNVDLNVIDKSGKTILHMDDALSNEKLCLDLLRNGADPTICDAKGKSFLFHSAVRGMDGKELINISMEFGSDINTTVRKDNSILMEVMSAFYKIPSNEIERRKSLMEMADHLVLKGIDVNIINENGENALYDAIRNKDFNNCAFLLGKRVDVNIFNNKQQTPLMIAAIMGVEVLDIILLLLQYNANPNCKNKQQQTLLEMLNHYILHTHNISYIEDNNILDEINSNGKYIVILKEVIKNSRYSLNEFDSRGQPIFFTPLLSGYYELFKLYIIEKFDINNFDKNRLNIFYRYMDLVFKRRVVYDDFGIILNTMIQYNVDVNATDKDGECILSKIIDKNTDINIFKLLINKIKFNYFILNSKGRTIAHKAILNKNMNIVRLLHKKDNNIINIADNIGILPIVYAVLLEAYDTVIELLDYENILIGTSYKVPIPVKMRFKAKIEKLDKIKTFTNNLDMKRKVTILIDQIKSDFSLIV